MNRTVIVGLVLAAGILVSTAVSLPAGESVLAALAAPVLMASAVMLAWHLAPVDGPRRQALFRRAAILAASVLVAGLVIIAADPARLKLMMPILGAAVSAPLLAATRRR